MIGFEIEMQNFTKVEFTNFKAFTNFTLSLKEFNIVVGPNNAGKSTVITAFRILATALRKATSRRAEPVAGPTGHTLGHKIDLSAISVASENVVHNYEEDQFATIRFSLSDKTSLLLYFPERDVCHLIPDANGKQCASPSQFKRLFNCSIGFVPILGPVDHHETRYQAEAARLALFNYTAARNFRNIWHHNPQHFEEFRQAVVETWPGMDIKEPEVDYSHEKARLYMYCPENRIDREIFWAGFGFQVWCQMLTHMIKSKNCSIFLIDEPDIYLHADLQIQLVGLLRNLGPDILIATHSTEIITEAEANEIVLVNKERHRSQRIKSPAQLEGVFDSLGSNVNPILTQLAKTRRALFVEGKDFQVLSKFARKVREPRVANRADFAVVPTDGFNPIKAKNLKQGMELTLGVSVNAGIILDRDYRSDEECKHIAGNCKSFSEFAQIHSRKEIENFLLVPTAIDRAAEKKVVDRSKRTGKDVKYLNCAETILSEYADSKLSYVSGQHVNARQNFEKSRESGLGPEAATQQAIEWFNDHWHKNLASKLELIPGKEALRHLNNILRERYDISVTSSSIIDAMTLQDIPREIIDLVEKMRDLSGSNVPEKKK